MDLWLFIGLPFAVVVLLAVWRGRGRATLTLDDHAAEPHENRRAADVLAADAARAADARITPNPGGFGF